MREQSSVCASGWPDRVDPDRLDPRIKSLIVLTPNQLRGGRLVFQGVSKRLTGRGRAKRFCR